MIIMFKTITSQIVVTPCLTILDATAYKLMQPAQEQYHY